MLILYIYISNLCVTFGYVFATTNYRYCWWKLYHGYLKPCFLIGGNYRPQLVMAGFQNHQQTWTIAVSLDYGDVPCHGEPQGITCFVAFLHSFTMRCLLQIAKGLGNAIFKLSKYSDLRVYTTGIYIYIYSIRNFTTDIDTNKVKGHKWHVLHPHARTKACMGRLIRRSEKERSQNDHLMVARIPLSATTKCCNCYTPWN